MNDASRHVNDDGVEPPDRASSREITFTSPDASADGMHI